MSSTISRGGKRGRAVHDDAAASTRAGGQPHSRDRSEGHSRAHSAGRGRGRGGMHGSATEVKLSTRRREEAELAALARRIEEEAPEPGTLEPPAELREFRQLPLSSYTLSGLDASKYRVMTQIQRVAIPHALAGRDILGAAKTGSGKTLAFLVPVLETLHRKRFSAGDGVGALIISPTRELCAQIFEVLTAVGSHHFALSAGMLCGGKSYEEERDAVGQLNLIVATPGRLLQHLEQSPEMDVSPLAALVLDEADRLLDMGFADTLNAILGYLPAPPARQTILFSATQTKSVRDLARLSLSAPEYLYVHDKASTATPAKLAQTYVVVPLQDKLNMLYSFIKSHLTSKTIVFVSSCKQARFLFESFRRLRPGVPLQLLHGKMRQERRTLVYYDFLKKPACVLFATDIAARGLDFPAVDWVVQLDCPEDVPTYIHRVGRTARFRSKGQALLVLLPSEAPAMAAALQAAKIPVRQAHVAPSAAVSVTNKLAAEIAADADLKYLAQRAFTSYIRSVLLQSNKQVFDVHALPLDAYAESLGLASAPVVKLGHKSADPAIAAALREEAHAKKNESKALARLKASIAAKKAARATRKESDDDSGDDMTASDDDNSDDEQLEDDDTSDRAEAAPLLRRKQSTASVDVDDLADSNGVEPGMDALTRRERDRVSRIQRMAKAIGAGSKSTRMNAFERVVAARGGTVAHAPDLDAPDELASAAAKHAAAVAARLAATEERDKMHQQLRVRMKHREERRRARGIEPTDDDDDDAEDERVVLLGSQRHSDDDDDNDAYSDDDERPTPAAASSGKRRRVEEAPPEPATALDLEQAALNMLAARRKAARTL